MLSRAIPGHRGLRVLAVFLGILMASASEFTIQLIPPEPRENQSVILDITGITETILFSEWYQGKEIPAENLIIRYNRDGQTNTGDKYFIGAEIHGNGSLLIRNVTKDLQGDYTASIQGTSKLYQQTVSLKVIVMAVPGIIKIQVNPPKSPEFQTVILNVTGIPEGIYYSEWFQGNEMLPSNQILRYNNKDGSQDQGNKYFSKAQIHFNGSLVIKNVTKDLQGNYTVHVQGVRNAYQDTVHLKLTVMAVPGIIKTQVNPPKSPEFQTVILNVTGIPEGIYYSEWFQGNEMLAINQILRYNNKDGSQDKGNRYFSKAEIHFNGSLVIKNVTKDLQGNYTVHVQGVRNAYQDTVHLKLTDTSGSSAKASASICIGISAVIVAAVAGGVYL